MAEVDPRAAAQMQAFIAEENQKAAVQQIIAKLTDTCWDKCMGKPGSKLSSWETDCISNCAERFLDASIFIVQRMHDQSRN
jgi:mitochondrial import inner membrane translocase subunit TIM8